MKISVITLCLLGFFAFYAESVDSSESLDEKLSRILEAFDTQRNELDAESSELINTILTKLRILQRRGILSRDIFVGKKSLQDDYWDVWSP